MDSWILPSRQAYMIRTSATPVHKRRSVGAYPERIATSKGKEGLRDVGLDYNVERKLGHRVNSMLISLIRVDVPKGIPPSALMIFTMVASSDALSFAHLQTGWGLRQSKVTGAYKR
jgi:hypothetical protein